MGNRMMLRHHPKIIGGAVVSQWNGKTGCATAPPPHPLRGVGGGVANVTLLPVHRGVAHFGTLQTNEINPANSGDKWRYEK